MLMDMTGINWTSFKLANGTTRYYYYVCVGGPLFWKRDHTREPEPPSKEFVDAYQAAKSQITSPVIINTISNLISDFKSTNPSKGYQRYYPIVLKEFGKARLSAFEDKRMRRDIKQWHRTMKDKPRHADYALTTLVKLLNYALDEALISHHCASRIEKFYTSDRAKIIWTKEEIELICSGAHEPLQFAILLCRYTGLRRGDLVEISLNADKGSYLQWHTSKSGKRREVIIPIVPDLRKLLDAIKSYRIKHNVSATTILFNSRGLPWTADGLSTSFGKQRDSVEIEKRLHDLRGSAVTEFRTAGVKLEDIAEIFGWSVHSVKAIIRKYVDREAIISSTVERIKRNAK